MAIGHSQQMKSRVTLRSMSVIRCVKRLGVKLVVPGAVVLGCLFWSVTACAAPVAISFGDAQGALDEGEDVVAFSYDVKRLFPLVMASLSASRPEPDSKQTNLTPVPRIASWRSFSLVHSFELERFREGFRIAHAAEPEVLATLMPAFDEVFKKYGDRPDDLGIGAIFSKMNGRQIWCAHVTEALNRIIDGYNENQGLGSSGDVEYQVRLAAWLGRRNEALQQAVVRQGGQPHVGFVQSVTDENGVANFDLPPGVWYVACQRNDGRYWYKALRVTARGGSIKLGSTDLQSGRLTLSEWIGS